MKRVFLPLWIAAILAGSAGAGLGLDSKPIELAIKKFLLSKKAKDTTVQAQGTAAADLNGDGRPETILLWTSVGPAGPATTLSVLTETINGFSEAAAIHVSPKTRLVGIKNGAIVTEEAGAFRRRIEYRWRGDKLVGGTLELPPPSR